MTLCITEWERQVAMHFKGLKDANDSATLYWKETNFVRVVWLCMKGGHCVPPYTRTWHL